MGRRDVFYLLSQQYEDGHAAHACYPEDGPGKFHGTGNKHDDLWMPMVVYAILSETGDFSLLNKDVFGCLLKIIGQPRKCYCMGTFNKRRSIYRK